MHVSVTLLSLTIVLILLYLPPKNSQALTLRIYSTIPLRHILLLLVLPFFILSILVDKIIPFRLMTKLSFLASKSLPLPTVSDLLFIYKSKMVGIFVLFSNSMAIRESMLLCIFVLLVDSPFMEQFYTFTVKQSHTLHLFNLSYISLILSTTNLYTKYSTFLYSFHHDFIISLSPLHILFSPTNSSSISTLTFEFSKIIYIKFALPHYFDFFSHEQVISFLSPFQTSLLSFMPKPHSISYHLVQNLSFPIQAKPLLSINSFIISSDYSCFFKTFLNICLILY